MSNYEIFTTEHDEIVHIRDLVEADVRERIAEHVLPAIDTMGPPKTESGRDAVTFLLDMSGSMRGPQIHETIKGLFQVAESLAEQGTPFEILGHTTRQWKGGFSRKDWLDAGRPQRPGRLDDLRLVIVKDMEEPWTDSRTNLFGLLKEGLLKENIDGEALAWARRRIEARGGEERLVVVTDGNPISDSTLSVNAASYLRDHLKAEIEAAEAAGLDMETLLLVSGRYWGDPEQEVAHCPWPNAKPAIVEDLGYSRRGKARVATVAEQLQGAVSRPKAPCAEADCPSP